MGFTIAKYDYWRKIYVSKNRFKDPHPTCLETAALECLVDTVMHLNFYLSLYFLARETHLVPFFHSEHVQPVSL